MNATTDETQILESIKGLPADCLAEIADHVQVVRRARELENQNRHLRDQNALLQEAIEMICFAFLTDRKDLDTAIQSAMSLQQRVRRGGQEFAAPVGPLEIPDKLTKRKLNNAG